MNVYIFAAPTGGNHIATGTTSQAGGMVANLFPVAVTTGANHLVVNTVYHLATHDQNGRRTPGRFLGVVNGSYHFAV